MENGSDQVNIVRWIFSQGKDSVVLPTPLPKKSLHYRFLSWIALPFTEILWMSNAGLSGPSQ